VEVGGGPCKSTKDNSALLQPKRTWRGHSAGSTDGEESGAEGSVEESGPRASEVFPEVTVAAAAGDDDVTAAIAVETARKRQAVLRASGPRTMSSLSQSNAMGASHIEAPLRRSRGGTAAEPRKDPPAPDTTTVSVLAGVAAEESPVEGRAVAESVELPTADEEEGIATVLLVIAPWHACTEAEAVPSSRENENRSKALLRVVLLALLASLLLLLLEARFIFSSGAAAWNRKWTAFVPKTSSLHNFAVLALFSDAPLLSSALQPLPDP